MSCGPLLCKGRVVATFMASSAIAVRHDGAASERSGEGKTTADPVLVEDLSREVYCVLGVPIDAVEMPVVLRRIEAAASSMKPYFISTPNLNFVVSYQSDADFREALLQ